MTTYATYGWPAGASGYLIDFWNAQSGQITNLVDDAQKQTRYTYGHHDDRPGLLIVYPTTSGGNKSKPYTFPINDPPSLSTLRWMVRSTLNDTQTATDDGIDFMFPENPKWSDSELDAYLREGIGMISNYIKMPVIIETTIDNFTSDILNRITIRDLSYFNDISEEWIQVPRFSRRGHRGLFNYWDMNGTTLRLYGKFPDNAKIEIHGEGVYPKPMNDQQELLIDANDWDILTIYAQGKAYMRLAGQSAQLDRFREEGRRRDDNPVTPVAKLLLLEAEKRIADRRGPRQARRIRM